MRQADTEGGYDLVSKNDIWRSLLGSCTITVPLILYTTVLTVCGSPVCRKRVVHSTPYATKTDDAKSLEFNNLTAKTNQELGSYETGSHGGESNFAQHHHSQGFLDGLRPTIEMGTIHHHIKCITIADGFCV